MCIKSEFKDMFEACNQWLKISSKIFTKGCLPLALGYIYRYEIKQSIYNKEATGIFLDLLQNGNIISFKMLNTYLKKWKSAKSLSLPRTRCQVSVTGPLVLWLNVLCIFVAQTVKLLCYTILCLSNVIETYLIESSTFSELFLRN